jgi:arthrofactin-type cyclic lipopeptide synthetase C
MVEHQAVINFLESMHAITQLTQDDRLLAITTLAFDIAALEIFLPLSFGACTALADIHAMVDTARLSQNLDRLHITALQATPAYWRILLDNGWEGSSHIKAICGGEALTTALAAHLKQRTGMLWNVYGPTESTIWSSIQIVKETNGSAPHCSIGRPIANTCIYLLDGHGQPVPAGVAGEIYIGGAGVARGYLNRPQLTAERFLADPFALEAGQAGARMYKTGDLGRFRPDGTIEFLGRNDDQVKIRGFRIELGEIEAKLLGYPGLREAVVVAREDAPGDKRLVAYYVGDADVAAQDLRAHLAKTQPDYMIPAAYVRLEALPLTPNGKLDRRALPAPEDGAFGKRVYEQPEGPVETAIAAIWVKLLHIERIGRHDNFFELGGHSLLAVQLASEGQKLGLDLPIASLFNHPTIEDLAIYVRGSHSERTKATPLRTIGDELPLFIIPTASGEISYGPALAKNIDASIPIYALTGPDVSQKPFTTFRMAAARFVKMIQEVQPQGTYRLAGWSLGGMMAYEVATQLIGMDQAVGFLGLIDTLNANHPNSIPILEDKPISDIDWLTRYLSGGDAEVEAKAQQILAELPSDANFAKKIHAFQSHSLLPLYLSVEYIQLWLRHGRTTSEAMREYCCQPIPTKIYLFTAEENPKLAGETVDPTLGWNRLLNPDQIHVTPVPGRHNLLMSSPYVETVGAAISRELKLTLDSDWCPPTPLYAPLVTIQTGRSKAAPIYCVPGAGGNVASFMDLVTALGVDYTVHGLQPRGLVDDQVPHSSVVAAANTYVRAITDQYPVGPLHLLGHSFGGWVVFEMADQLRSIGRVPDSVTMVDSQLPDSETLREYSNIDVILLMVELFEMSAGQSWKITVEDLRPLSTADRLTLLHAHLVESNLMPKSSHPISLTGVFRTFSTHLQTSYKPHHTYEHALNLILLPDTRLGEADAQVHLHDIEQQWRLWAPHLEAWRGSGNHITILRSPHVAMLADLLRSKYRVSSSAS